MKEAVEENILKIMITRFFLGNSIYISKLCVQMEIIKTKTSMVPFYGQD